MKASLLFLPPSLITSISSSVGSVLESVPSLNELLAEVGHSERWVLGRARSNIESNLTYQPLRKELMNSLLKKKRLYSTAEVLQGEVVSTAFYRHFSKLSLLTLDLIYVPKVLRGNGVGHKLLFEMVNQHPDADNVHLILDYANRKAFLASEGLPLAERILKVPTLRNLHKLGFSNLTHLGTMTVPGDRYTYPEVVLTRSSGLAQKKVLAKLD